MMKNLLLALLACNGAAFSANAQFGAPNDIIDVTSDFAKITISGNGGGWACAVQNQDSWSQQIYVARAMTKTEADVAAANACLNAASFGDRDDCKNIGCDEDLSNVRSVKISISASTRDRKAFELIVNDMSLGGMCVVKNTDSWSQKLYLAKAGTMLEAKAIAMNACLAQASFGDKMDCQLQSCETIRQPANGSINTGGVQINIPGVGPIVLPPVMPSNPPRTRAGRIFRDVFGNGRSN